MIRHRLLSGIGLLALVGMFGGIHAPSVHAAALCVFDRDLELGIEGTDVRCLQQYLNSAGFTVSLSGVGSPGHETTQFKDLTKKAVAAWQAANGISATGYFGPVSRAKYLRLAGGAPSAPAASGDEALKAQIASLLAQVNALKTSAPAAASGKALDAQNAIKKAITMLKNADDEIDDASGDIGYADKELDDARDSLFSAVNWYFKNDFAQAVTDADKAYEKATDAFKDAGGETSEDKTDDYIDKISDKLDDARDKVDDSDSSNVKEADNDLDDAEDYLDKAYDAFDDEKYDDAKSYAAKARDLIDDALDVLESKGDKNDAKDAISDAENAIDDAQDAIDKADDRGKDVDDANDMLDDAKAKLKKANSVYDDKDYDKAVDYANDAEDLANDAQDEV
ncbi:MAG: peptidoglycan-binding protein [bacterium]